MPFDHVSTLMTQLLNFIGVTDVTVVRAEKQAFGPEVAGQEVAHAKQEVEVAASRAA